MQRVIKELEIAVGKAGLEEEIAQVEFYRNAVVGAMNIVHAAVGKLERLVDASIWSLPTYTEMLFLK